jgi:hypothetical protein
MNESTLTTASESLKTCRECEEPVFSNGLCSRHCKQMQRQRDAFMKVYPGRTWCPSYFVADVRVKKGRNPKPSMVSLDVAAGTHGYDQAGNLTRLDKKAKTKHLPKEGGDSRVDTWGNAGKQANKTHRKNMVQQFKTVHYAERDRAVWLRGQGVSVPNLPRTAHIPTVPLSRNPAGWGKSSPPSRWVGAFTNVEMVETEMGSYERMSGYRITPTGVSKPCACKACRQSRRQRVPQA